MGLIVKIWKFHHILSEFLLEKNRRAVLREWSAVFVLSAVIGIGWLVCMVFRSVATFRTKSHIFIKFIVFLNGFVGDFSYTDSTHWKTQIYIPLIHVSHIIWSPQDRSPFVLVLMRLESSWNLKKLLVCWFTGLKEILMYKTELQHKGHEILVKTQCCMIDIKACMLDTWALEAALNRGEKVCRGEEVFR